MFNDQTPRQSNFDDVFGTGNMFSPFRFAGAKHSSSHKNTKKTPFAFTFKKTIPDSPLTLPVRSAESDSAHSFSEDSLNCDPVSVAMTIDTGSVKKNVGLLETAIGGLGVEAWGGVRSEGVIGEGGHGNGVCGDDGSDDSVNSEGVRSGAVFDVVRGEKGEVEVGCASEEGKREEVSECPTQETKEEEDMMNSIDFPYFQKLHSDTCDVLSRRCGEWSEKSQSLETETEREEDEERRRVKEDVIDQIRAAIGQSRLLMKRKLTQYHNMVLGAQSGETHTSPQDLQGYWDLVYIQVEGLYKRFDCLEELERNNWQQPQQNGMRTRGKGKKCVAPLKKAPQTEKQIAARDKREATRLRLREMRMAAARRGREEGGKEGRGGEGCPESIPEPDQMKNETSSDDTPVEITPTNKVTTPPCQSGSRGNQRRKSSRRKSRVSRRQSESLMSFSMSAGETGGENMPSSSPSTQSSIFSPPRHTSQLTPPNLSVEVPTADLLNFDSAPIPLQLAIKSPFKWTPRGLPMTPRKKKSPTGASVRRYISITPSKRIRDQFTADIYMSPAKRSLRNIGCTGKAPSGRAGCYEVSSLLELPEGINLAYCPNKALL